MRRPLPLKFLLTTFILLTAISGFVSDGLAQALTRKPVSSPPMITYEDVEYRLTVKFADQVKARALPDGRLTSLNQAAIQGATAVTDRQGLTYRPLINMPEAEIIKLEQRALARSGRAQPDLAGMMIVEMPNADVQAMRAVAEELRGLPEVEYVFLQPLAVPPPGDIAPATPDLEANQGYLAADPGMDVDWVWAQGNTGAGVRLSDCEYGWNADHEDLNDIDLHLEPGQTIHPDVFTKGWDSHGTAVVGETSAVNNGYGVTGMAHGAAIHTYPEWSVEEGGRRVTAVTNAINDSAAGDVVLLEMQAQGVGASGNYVPAEYDPSVWTVVKAGTDAGVIVVGAAGNGNQDLDHADYQDYMDRGDSGAIIVGAGSPDAAHDKKSFSTYGSRVDLQGWGSGVFTLGYGTFAEYGGDKNQRYSSTFNGTSSASPFVASACVLVQTAAIGLNGTPMTPAEMRSHLAATGIPQGAGGNIGPFPDLRAAINGLEVNTAPMAVCQDVQVSADANCQGLVTADMVDDGSTDPDGDPITFELDPAGPFGLGVTEVTLYVYDDRGGVGTCTASVTVLDTTPPVVACPGNIQIECTEPGGVSATDVQLTAFFDAYSATDYCDDSLDLLNDAPAFFAGPCDGAAGVTVVTWTATDDAGNTAQCSATVTVIDTTPPELEVTVSPQVLWPPNHKMVDVEYTVTVSDACDASPAWELVSVTSNEPEDDLGDGTTEPDVMGVDAGTMDTTVSLRAERQGGATGRVYTATFTATDCSGNTAMTYANVYVPHDKSDIGTILSGVGGPARASRGEITFMISGASLWRKKIPAEYIGGDVEGGSLGTVNPLSAVITNTAGLVPTSAFFVKDVDGDDHPDVLLAFPQRELVTLEYESAVEDGAPVMVLEIAEEKFMVLEMNNIEDIDLDLDLIIGKLRSEEDEGDELGLDRKGDAVVAAVRSAGIVATAPNPFNPKTTISFYVPNAGHVDLAVYDISGRMIKRLVDDNVGAGDHSVAWLGDDTRGSRVASGVYFFRMSAGGVVDTKRAVMIK